MGQIPRPAPRVTYSGATGHGATRAATVGGSALTALAGVLQVYDLRDMPGWDPTDIGPALQAAFAAIHAASGRGRIRIPNGQNVIVTPVSYNLDNGERIIIEGESEDAAIVINCDGGIRTAAEAIFVGHGVSTTGLLFGVRNLVLRGFEDQTYSMNHAIYVDMDGEGTSVIENVECFGCCARESVIRLEDGTAIVRNLTFAGCATDPGNGAGLLRLWQTYRGDVRHLYHFNTASYAGSTWNGQSCNALLEWQAPQLNFGGAPSTYPRGNLYLDEWKADTQCTNAILINNIGSYQGGKVSILHGQATQPLAGSSQAPVLVRAVDELLVDSLYANCGTAGSGYMVYLFAVTRATLRHLHGETAADGGAAQNCNLVGANNLFGNTESILLEECVLGTTSSFSGANGGIVCGIDVDPTVTRCVVRSKGVESVVRKASAAIPANSLVAIDPAATTAEGIIVVPAGADGINVLGVALDAAGALNDLIRVVEFDGQQVTLLSDGAVAIVPGDAIEASPLTAGEVAKHTAPGNPIVGVALTGAVAVAGTAFKALFGKAGSGAVSVDGAVNSGVRSTGYLTTVGGELMPAEKDIDIYIQSDSVWLPVTAPSGVHGSDDNDGRNPSRPLATLSGFFKKYGGCTDAVRYIVHLMGSGGSDPVDHPANSHIYWMRQIDHQVSESFRAKFCIRGPRSMLSMAGNLTFGVATDGGFINNYCHISLGIDCSNFQSMFLRGVMSDGRELTFPWPIARGDGTGVFIGGRSALFWNTFGALADHFEICSPAALIHTDGGDNQMNGVHITGRGAHRIGDRFSAGDPAADRNPFSDYERVWFGRSTHSWSGSMKFESCRFDDVSWFGPQTEPWFQMCVFTQVCYIRSRGRFLTQSSALDTDNEADGRMLSYVYPLIVNQGGPTMNPVYPSVGIEMCVCQDGQLNIGEDLFSGGQLRIHKGLVIALDSNTYPIRVIGQKSGFFQSDAAYVIVDAAGGALSVIWASQEANVRLCDSLGTVQVKGEATNHLRVGKGAVISLGTGGGNFRDAASWNGNFCRRLESSGGKPTDEGARIWDKAWEPGGYWSGK